MGGGVIIHCDRIRSGISAVAILSDPCATKFSHNPSLSPLYMHCRIRYQQGVYGPVRSKEKRERSPREICEVWNDVITEIGFATESVLGRRILMHQVFLTILNPLDLAYNHEKKL